MTLREDIEDALLRVLETGATLPTVFTLYLPVHGAVDRTYNMAGHTVHVVFNTRSLDPQ